VSGEPMPAGEVLVEVLRQAGVDTAFGVVSVHNLPLVDALDAHLRFVPVRHEASAVNAADGYGRARGGLGVAVTSTGTGAGNAAGSLIESLSAGSSVLHVTGQIPSEHLGTGRGVIHETKDQIGMLAAVSKAAATVTDREAAGEVLQDAVAAALAAPRGPVSVEWPIDLQYGDARSADPVPPGAPAPPDRSAVEAAASVLAAARRPLLWLGGGAVDAGPEVAELVDRLEAGVLTSNSGRGTVREDGEFCIGNYAANPAAAALLAEADVLLSIGTHFRSNETKDYALALPRPHIQVDIDPAALGRAYPCDVGVAGDAATVLRAILDALTPESATDPAWPDRVGATRADVRVSQREGLGPQAALCDAMRRVLPDDAIVARDVTIPSSSWGNRLLEVYDHRTNVFPRGGGIGQGLAMGLGAAIGRPDVPVAVMVGDGGLAVHLGELLTVAQEQPELVVVLFNDRGYGVLRNMQDHYVGRRSGVDLHTPDFAVLAAAADLPHQRVCSVEDFEMALAKAVEREGPSIVEVDVDAIGPMPRPFIPPVPVPSP
jgi:acetolactate synthase I/II/III large subunit